MKSFGKRSWCPSSQTMLTFIQNALSAQKAKRVAAHLRVCDFCGAERHFLTRHVPSDVALSSAVNPSAMSFSPVMVGSSPYTSNESRAA